MSLGRKYVFATVMYLILPICILITCSSVLCVLMSLSMCLLSVCVYGGVVGYFKCFSFLCEICYLYCDDVRLGAVY